MEGFKHYRIGPFARYLCVTTSFLKHYEDEGLISVVQQDNGYRYYPFPEAAHILEYMRLHSYGVPLKEMRTAVTGPTETAFENIDRHADELQKKADRLQAIVDEHRRFRKWFDRMKGEPFRWEVKAVDPIYFLPHSSGQDFLEEKGIYEVFQGWCDNMPLTKSAMYVRKGAEPGSKNELYWGLAVAEETLHRGRIPVNDAVMLLPESHAFVYHFYDLEDPTHLTELAESRHPAFDKMRELGFHAKGDALIVIDMALERDGVKRGFGRFVIPIEE